MNHVDTPFESPAVISFCPGILGLERGLERAIGKVRVMAYVEIEAFIIANLVAGMEAGVLDPAPVWSDAKTFDGKPFRGKIHGIIGGYPCPGESLAGLREGHLYKGFIWPSIRRTIAAARPLWCFFENVDDHLTGTYPIVQRSLRNMGYAVEAGIYTAQEVGAPHERSRLFILAMANACSNGFGRKDSAGPNENDKGRQKECIKKSKLIGNSYPPGRLPSDETANKKLGNTGSTRLSSAIRGQFGSIYKQDESCQGSKPCRTATEDRWPLPQGKKQYEWEHPRTTQSAMGSTIDGYNFREDLLRAYGNSVVEQTAELAFNDLLRKHCNP